MRCMKGVYENTDEASPFRRRPDFDLLHLKNGAQDTLPLAWAQHHGSVKIITPRQIATGEGFKMLPTGVILAYPKRGFTCV